MPGALGGKVALVTGAGSGLGRAIAVEYAVEGAAVLCSDRDAVGVQDVVAAIRGSGGTATAHVGDVTSESDCAAAVALALAELGGLDVVVANAGIPGEGKAHEISLDDWSKVIGVNLTGVFLTVRAALPHLVGQGAGSIVLTASIAGLVGLPNIPAYAAAKGGVVALGRQLAREYAPDGIRTNVIAPGTILTPLVEDAFRQRHGDGIEEALSRRATAVPLGRLGSPEDVARAAVYLGSDASGWVTGTVLTVDGGNVHLGPVQG
ncbi:SDR family NAD(P)-dependent oxidoreductase [Nocardioides hwasunensis]|uniref:SDR family oxidoreductase n=2 Tax=Nocardioides hwasunensis TaxID=397258 RepID=A0ABR8ML55_9ACTN|nr:SDR family oxidoreductase [Nocardioides hwasunensis]